MINLACMWIGRGRGTVSQQLTGIQQRASDRRDRGRESVASFVSVVTIPTKEKHMKYVLLFTSPSDDTWQRLPEDRQTAIHGEIMTWWQKHEANGVIVGGERLHPGTTATPYHVGDDLSVQTIDGPYV